MRLIPQIVYYINKSFRHRECYHEIQLFNTMCDFESDDLTAAGNEDGFARARHRSCCSRGDP